MFEKLRTRWNVSGWQLILIIFTFAIGGSITGYTAKKLMNLFSVQPDWLWAILYIILVTVLWPITVIIASVPFGQFSFFIKYIGKIGSRAGLVKKKKENNLYSKRKSIAILASGTGSNAQQIINYFRNNSSVCVSLIICNNPAAGVLKIAEKEKIPSLLVEKKKFFSADAYRKELQELQVDLLVLAGFLWKIPSVLIKAFPQKIINIHPALLPKYGGKGMYGHHVHEVVIAAGEKESGITIHYVDELYDHGKIIFQARCPVYEDDTANSLAQRVHQLEHEHYPRIIEGLLK